MPGPQIPLYVLGREMEEVFPVAFLRSFAYEHAPNTWQLVVGGAMLLVILFLPEGLWSLVLRRRRASA